MWLLLIISISLLGSITWFDFRERSIPVVLLIGESIVAILYFDSMKIPGYFFIVLINFSLTCFNLGLLYIWFRWRKGLVSFFDKVMGWGDVFMFGIATLFFEPIFFLYFIIVAAFLGGVFGGVMYLVNHKKTDTNYLIPLGGIMSILLIVTHIFHFFGFSLI